MMTASRIEFKLRYFTHSVVYVLGFLLPWNRWVGFGERTTWVTVAGWLGRHGWLSFQTGSELVLSFGIACAVIGAWLRVWGSSYLGAGVVQDGAMHGDAVVADGPYRHLRNPLYLGTIFNTLAIALLMAPAGAVFAVVGILLIQMRLAGGEERYLTEQIGVPYLRYKTAVPRWMPSIAAKTPASGVKPRWIEGMLAETYVIGVAVVFVAFGWRYDSWLMIKGVLISFGLSLVVRAFLPGAKVGSAGTIEAEK